MDESSEVRSDSSSPPCGFGSRLIAGGFPVCDASPEKVPTEHTDDTEFKKTLSVCSVCSVG